LTISPTQARILAVFLVDDIRRCAKEQQVKASEKRRTAPGDAVRNGEIKRVRTRNS
jgi:hypothetical protein